jgi:hypothetical protein
VTLSDTGFTIGTDGIINNAADVVHFLAIG